MDKFNSLSSGGLCVNFDKLIYYPNVFSLVLYLNNVCIGNVDISRYSLKFINLNKYGKSYRLSKL